ncbi:MAG: OmpA family protein, partial [Desulfobulbaceae bacterium]|nr:OmpA family protein [Desulfobulbaceae bacterium]
KEREVSLAAKDSEVSVIESARNGLAAELNDLQNRLSKALDTTTKVNDLLKQALRDKGDAEGKVLVLTGKVRELEQSLKEHKVQQEATVAQALTETNNESDARLNALNDVIAGHQATIGQLNKKLQEALRKSTATPSQPLVDQAKLSRLQTQLADKERERQSLNTKVAELVNQLDQARKKLSGAGTVKSDNVSALEQKKSELLKSLASKNERIGSLEGEVKALEGQRQKAAMFEEQIAALKESISEKANKLDDANRLSTELSHKLSEAERQKASYGIKLGALGELLADVQSDKKRSSQRAVEAEKEIKALKEKFNSLERERDALITELESRQSKIEALLSSLDMNKITSEKVHENALLIKNGTDERVEALETLLHAKELAFQRLTTLTGSLINSKTELTAMKDEMEQLKVLLRAKDVAFHKLAVRLGAMATMPEPLPVSVGELTQIKSLLASKSTAFQKLAVTTAGLVGREQKARQELVRLQEKHDALLRDFSDSDNDSIPDSRDACPQTVVGALVGENGCVSDADGDGVPNDSDYCPNSSSKEVNVLGCAIEEVILLQGVSFTPGKSVLTAAAQEWLKPLYSQLKLHTAFTFEVAGHTDSVGDHNRNVLISYRRAASVRDFFTTHGLDETRFTIRGYGPDQPVGDNNTPEGRKLNRRVEMYFTQPTLEIAQ